MDSHKISIATFALSKEESFYILHGIKKKQKNHLIWLLLQIYLQKLSNWCLNCVVYLNMW